MWALNQVALIGRLVRDPELRYTGSGTAVASMRIAVDGAGDRDEDGTYRAGFFDVEVWKDQAENCAQYLGKGSQCGVTGRLKFREWEARDGSGKRNKVEVVATSVQFLDTKADREARESGQTSIPAAERTAPAETDFTSADDDLPF